MNTAYLLAARFESPTVHLSVICEEFFGLDVKKAHEKAREAALPVPAVRLGGQKAPWLIRITDLAEYIDKSFDEARKAHRGAL